jgi:uncharacterized protein
MKKFRKQIYVLLGLIAVALGTLGAILPILPTTPFLLLALYCFSKGSERWHNWFIKTKLYKKYLEDYVQKRAMTLKQKVAILLFADVMMAFPLVMVDKLFVRIMIIIVLLTKYYYFIFRIKTIKPDEAEIVLMPEGVVNESNI